MKFILAVDKSSFGIGYQNKLAWNIPEDLKFLRETIQDNPILVGRNTYSSLPNSLKNKSMILSNKSIETSWDHYLSQDHSSWWVLGGKSVYESLLKPDIIPHIDSGIIVWVNFNQDRPVYDCYLTEFCNQIPQFFKPVSTKILANNENYAVEAVYLEK